MGVASESSDLRDLRARQSWPPRGSAMCRDDIRQCHHEPAEGWPDRHLRGVPSWAQVPAIQDFGPCPLTGG